MIRRPPRSTLSSSSAASDVYKRQELERTIDPYGLQLVAGEWYLIGWCHLRLARRTFRLSRIRSRVTHATRAPHDFEAPESFDIGAYRNRPCLLYTSDAADEEDSVDLGGRRIIKKKKKKQNKKKKKY